MVRSVVFILVIIVIFLSKCRSQTIVIREPTSCGNETYVIPLFGTRIIQMMFNRTRLRQLNIHTVRVHTSISDRKVVEFQNRRHSNKRVVRLLNDTNQFMNQSMIVIKMKIRANYINRTYMHYSIETTNTENETHSTNCSAVLMVSQPKRLIDRIFIGSIPFVIMFISIQMGILLDIEVLQELMRRPIQVLIGFVCQYGIMPIIAYSITKIFRYEPLYGLGLFVVGCCPGGSASNQWTVIFDGDLNLSAFMSFASTVASFFMMPLWLYTLGQYAYLSDLKIRVPFWNLAQSLLTIIGPLGIGMILVYFIPKLKPLVKRIVKPMLILLIMYFFVFGAFVNYYLFSYIDLRTALTAPLLPWLGFLLGGTFAWICKQDKKRIITIGIETGVQNVGIAFMVLLYSFPAPQNSQSAVIPLIVAYLSTQPFYIVLIYRIIYRKCCKTEKPVRHISLDTLSKTTHQLSEAETEPMDKTSPKRKVSIPLAVAGLAADPEPLQI